VYENATRVNVVKARTNERTDFGCILRYGGTDMP